jgi:hypothetical protein
VSIVDVQKYLELKGTTDVAAAVANIIASHYNVNDAVIKFLPTDELDTSNYNGSATNNAEDANAMKLSVAKYLDDMKIGDAVKTFQAFTNGKNDDETAILLEEISIFCKENHVHHNIAKMFLNMLKTGKLGVSSVDKHGVSFVYNYPC